MRYAGVAVALAVVLAGCNVPFAPGAPTATPDATRTATSTAEPTPTATPPPDPADAGLGAGGVEDPLVLANAHEDRLRNRSYTVTRSVTVRGPDGTVLVRNHRVVEATAGREQFVWNATSSVADGTPTWLREAFARTPVLRAYSNGTATVVVLVDVEGERHVMRYDEEGSGGSLFLRNARSLSGADVVRDAFLQVGTRVTGVDRVDGTVRYRLAAADGSQEYALPRAPAVTADVASLEASVERTGVVRRLVLRYTVERNGTRYGVTSRLAVTGVGETTVERPAWAEDPRPNASVSPAVSRDRTTP